MDYLNTCSFTREQLMQFSAYSRGSWRYQADYAGELAELMGEYHIGIVTIPILHGSNNIPDDRKKEQVFEKLKEAKQKMIDDKQGACKHEKTSWSHHYPYSYHHCDECGKKIPGSD
jgi:hypothetical protein